VFQNHAVSICEDTSGNFITLDEAHFICGILNAPIVSKYMAQSSDSRSFPVRLRIKIPKFDSKDKTHKRIAALSKKAHDNYDETTAISRILSELDDLYLQLVRTL
jgi:hypothetical protein